MRNIDHEPVQDNQREKQIIKLFEPILRPRQEKERDPRAPPDATFVPNGDPVEVKCCTKKNKSVSTVHGFTRRHLERFRTRHLIFAFGPNLKSGFKIDRVFYAHPQAHLQGWLANLTAQFDEHDQIVEYLLEGKDLNHFRVAKIARLRSQLELSLNDPTIPWRTVLQCPELLDNYCERLCDLIERYPLKSATDKNAASKSFADGLISWV